MFLLRISLRPHHMKTLGTGKIDIRGTLQDGLLLAPGTGVKPYKVGTQLLYVACSLPQFDGRVPRGARSLIWLRPSIKDGHIQLPAMPESWIRIDPEFQREVYHHERKRQPQIFETGTSVKKLSPFPADPAVTVKSETTRVDSPAPEANGNGHAAPAPVASTQGLTAPLPKQQQVPDYQVPGTLRDMEHALATKIGEVRAIMQAMQDKTGLQFTLDRNLRVAVILREKPDK